MHHQKAGQIALVGEPIDVRSVRNSESTVFSISELAASPRLLTASCASCAAPRRRLKAAVTAGRQVSDCRLLAPPAFSNHDLGGISFLAINNSVRASNSSVLWQVLCSWINKTLVTNRSSRLKRWQNFRSLPLGGSRSESHSIETRQGEMS